MRDFEGNLRSVIFHGQHTLIQYREPDGKIAKMRESIANIEAYLSLNSCYQSSHVVFASMKMTADDLSHRAAFFKFQNGTFVLGKLKDTTKQFDDPVIYVAFFDGSSGHDSMIFAQIPKQQSFRVGIGRETDRCYITFASKKPWKQLDFGEGNIYTCSAKEHNTAHPDISRIKTEGNLPEIDFSAKLLDEATQLNRSSEELNLKNSFIFVAGELRLQ